MSKRHGKSRTRLYRIWSKMKRRCKSPKSRYYKYYGAKGITVCDEWEESFMAFEEWAIEAGYRESEFCKLEIHRTDSHGDYNPDNCEWVEPQEHGMIHGNDTADRAIKRNTTNFYTDPWLFEESHFEKNKKKPFIYTDPNPSDISGKLFKGHLSSDQKYFEKHGKFPEFTEEDNAKLWRGY